ncbi:hypothetical protein BDW75DRAFT_207652 [Aspergillus navahoensis]
MAFDVVWARCSALDCFNSRGFSSQRCMNIIDCVDFLLRPLLPDTHFVLRRPWRLATRAEQAIRLFRVKRSAFYGFPLLGATATASAVSYNIELFLSISVFSQGGVFVFSPLVSSFVNVVLPFLSRAYLQPRSACDVQFLMGHFWRSGWVAGQNMTSTE